MGFHTRLKCIGLLYVILANNGKGNVELYECKVLNCSHIAIIVIKHSGQFNCISYNHSFTFLIKQLAAFDGGSLPVLAVQRLEVAVYNKLALNNFSNK